MARDDAVLTAAAGEHYVAFRLAMLGYVVAIPRGGSPAVDLLVSNQTGTRTVAIQVKTTAWASRTRGRGAEKRDDRVEFPLGTKATRTASEAFVYVFVDLRRGMVPPQPVCYVVPSKAVKAYCESLPATVKWVRWHLPIATVKPYAEAWRTIEDQLTG